MLSSGGARIEAGTNANAMKLMTEPMMKMMAPTVVIYCPPMAHATRPASSTESRESNESLDSTPLANPRVAVRGERSNSASCGTSVPTLSMIASARACEGAHERPQGPIFVVLPADPSVGSEAQSQPRQFGLRPASPTSSCKSSLQQFLRVSYSSRAKLLKCLKH